MLRNAFIALMALGHFSGNCEVRVHKIFGDNMVLQRDTANKVWGWTDPGEEIVVSIGDKTLKVTASENGAWEVIAPPFQAGGPYNLTIQGGDNTITFKNVVFGEVWLCGGQSNMQFTLRMLGKDIASIDDINNPLIRQFRNELDVDYLPKHDLKGGYWVEASNETVPDFSATAYYFGKVLYDSLKVPIGLINTNLGATTIETWMSGNALKKFPQFEDLVNIISTRNKNFVQMNQDLAKFRETWDRDHYLVGPGFREEWYNANYDDSDWATMTVPNFWEYEGLDHDGAVWFRKEFDLPEGFAGDSLSIHLNQIDDYDITWVNGVKVGESFGNRNFRNYKVSSAVLKPEGNSLVVRVFDIGGLGGFHTAAFWGNPILVGEWKYRKGLEIDKVTFPKPDVPNGSIFSYPTLLFNGNIAPISNYSIKGAIWYQGESNVFRAEEYRTLLPTLVQDWRGHWGYNFPFLVVQLANHHKELEEPGESTWAELREAQYQSLGNVATHVAVTIDIGDADDIHPKNKEDVGYRLALGALKQCYEKELVSSSPTYRSMSIRGSEVTLEFANVGTGLKTNDKYGYLSGFQIAGKDRKFYWAKARLEEGNRIVVSSHAVEMPTAVRYAWSDNPGKLNVYSKEGLPLAPFRTDDWQLSTEGQVYDDTPHQF